MYTTTVASAILSVFVCCAGVRDVYAGQYLKISDELQLYYEDKGSGSPIIFIPGWTASEVVFEHQIDHFAQAHRVIAYDPRSQGFSSHTLDHNTYAQHGHDLAGLIEKLGLKHVTLIGWSAACLDAYSYIREYGVDNLAAFVCIDSAAQGLSATPGDWAMVQADEKSLADWHGIREKLVSDQPGFGASFFKFMNARDVTPEETDWFVRQQALCPPYAALLLQADWLFSDYRPEARAIDGKLPVLFAVGELNAAAAMPWIKANMPHAETFTIKRHMSFWSEPESFNVAVDAFLAKGLRMSNQ